MNASPPPEPLVGILPLGPLPELVPKVIAAHVVALYNLTAEVLTGRPEPFFACDPRRGQCDAGKIVQALEDESFNSYTKIVGVTAVDLFVPIFTYVLGESRQGGRVALLSIHRLSDTPAVAQARLLERCAKVALHELGHLYNLTHCNDPCCLMAFAGTAAELDGQRLSLCRYCTYFLRAALPRRPT